MSKHFCCCIPVRFGVFVFSLLSTVSAGLLAAILWFIVHEIAIKADNYTNVNERTKIIVIVLACVFSIMALLSLFGFVGSITRNRRFVKAFSFMAWILFFCSLAAAGLLLWAVYTEKNITTDCINSDDKGNVSVDECTTHLSTGMKIAITVIVAVHVFIELYIVTIVRRYVEQLEEEDGWQGPYKLTSTDVNQGLMNTAPNSYPYSDPHHAYGNA